MIRIEDGRPALYQWDLNRRVELLNIKPGTEVHFADEYENVNCPVVISYEENDKVFADIPNILLQRHGIITAYVYVHENNKAFTEYHIEILVLSRPKPSDYIYTETEVKSYELLEERIKEIEENGASGGNIVVDEALSETSTNPVQNKVVTKEIRQLSEEIDDQKEETKKIDNFLNNAENGKAWTHIDIDEVLKKEQSATRCAFPITYFKNDVKVMANAGYYIASILIGTNNSVISDTGWTNEVLVNAYDNIAVNLRKQDNSQMTDEEVKNAITIKVIGEDSIVDKSIILTELERNVLNKVSGSGEAKSPTYTPVNIIGNYKLKRGCRYVVEANCETELTDFAVYINLYDNEENRLCQLQLLNGLISRSLEYLPDKDYENAHIVALMSVASGLKVNVTIKRRLEDSVDSYTAMLKAEKSLSLFDFFTKPCYHHLNQETISTIPAQSLYDVQYARKLGFDLIEVNEHLCSDGVYVCKHGVSGKLGYALKAVDGNDYSNTAFSSVTSTWLRENITYNSPIQKYQGVIPTLDEFCLECNNLDMKIKIGSYDALDIVRKYLPDNMIWITSNNEREKDFTGVVEYIWYGGASVDACINNCVKIGAPLNIVIASGTFDTRTDEEISELVKRAHESGFTVGFVYPTPNSITRAKKLGVDIWGSTGIDINPFDVGTKFNIVDLSDENLTLSNATYDSNNDVITMNTGGSISVNSDSFKSGILSVKVRYSGNISIKSSTNENQNLNNYESDGMSEIVYAVVLQRKTESYTRWVEIVANASTEIYDIDIRCSHI